MKKTLLTITVILIAAAVISFGIGLFFHWAYMSALDGSSDLYARLAHRRSIFLTIGIVLLAAGIIVSLFRVFMVKR